MSEQNRLLQEFFDQLVAENLRYRDLGLTAANRASAFITSALAVSDIEYQQTSGRSIDEDDFIVLVKAIYRGIRVGDKPKALS